MVNTILFMGIHRSGNHGLINWLIGNLRGKIIHINALHHRDLTPELYSRYSEKKALQVKYTNHANSNITRGIGPISTMQIG